MIRSIIALLSVLWMYTAQAELAYDLHAKEIALNTYFVEGKMEDFSPVNGGNIVNTAFVVTESGIVVFDTGPSLRYGLALRELISSISDKEITHVFNSHHHPDHFLGNQAFKDNVIYSLPETGQLIAAQGGDFASNMYNMVGDWMRGTEVHLPDKPIDFDNLSLGSHQFRIFSFSGHTGSDLVVLDETTGVLFAFDLVFFKRTLTTPHTPNIEQWLEDLQKLRGLSFKLLVPGHGPVNEGQVAIEQSITYLKWLDLTLEEAAIAGLSMSEVMSTPVPDEFKELKLIKEEFSRSIVHLYAAYEDRHF